MSEPPAPPRPPPLPASLVRRAPPPPPPAPVAPTRAPPVAASSSWQPLPEPRLAREGRPHEEQVDGALPPLREGLLSSRMAWIALMGWAFVLVVLLLVVVPTDAIPRLMPPYRQPISAGGYGPLVAVFALVAIVIAAAGIIVMWTAMGRDFDPPADGSNHR